MDDYYTDIQFMGNGQFTLNGTGETLITNGTSTGEYVSAISDPVNCTIHNTALNLAPCSGTNTIGFTATDGKFDFVGNDATYDPNFPGTIVTYCNGSFTNCQFKADALSTYYGYSMCVAGNGTWNSLLSTGTGDGNYNALGVFTGDNHNVTFTSCYGTTGIDIVGGTSPIAAAAVTVSGGEWDNVGIVAGVYAGSPWWPVSISEAGFDDIHGQGIIINEAAAPTVALEPPNQLYSILLDNNDFKTYDVGASGYSGFSSYSSGILVANAPDVDLNDDLRQDITVTNNTFDTAGSYLHTATIWAAIHFQDATGDIGFNQITPSMVPASSVDGSKYTRGIWNESSYAVYPYQNETWTFICSNTASGMIGSSLGCALQTDYYKGYSKLNNFSYSEYDQVSGYNDNGHIDFSTYTNASIAAYGGFDNSMTDLSGVHASSSWSADDQPAQNSFTTTFAYAPAQQIFLASTSGQTAIVYLGKEPGSPGWTVYGDNTIIAPTDYFDIGTDGTANVYDISNNYWGGSTYHNLDVTASGGFLSIADPFGGVECSSGLDMTKKKRPMPLSSLKVDTTVNPCGTSLSEGYALESQNVEPEGYDTLQAFMENCPLYPNSYEGFTMILGAAQGAIGKGYGSYPDFLAWLKQVLYLNPDSNWYCGDVDDMVTAVQNAADAESICRYILASGKCPQFTSFFAQINIDAVNGRHMAWLDSLYKLHPVYLPYGNDSINADTLAHPFADTAVPTLFQDSLQILLGPQYAAVQETTPSAIGSQALLSAQLIENPIQDEIDISYQMGRTALVTMELRDVLGRSVPIANAKYQLEQPGDHTATLPAPNLPAGIYYLRVTTDVGDAITLKIVKE